MRSRYSLALPLAFSFCAACSSDPDPAGAGGSPPSTAGTSTGGGGAATGGSSSTAGGGGGGQTSSAGTSAGGMAGGAAGTTSSGASGGGAASAGTGGSGGDAGAGGSGGAGGGQGGAGGAATAFKLSSPGWQAVDNSDCTAESPATCPLYPEDNTNFGANVSPEMSWSPGPAGTQSYAMVLKDLSNNVVHWAIWDIPAGASKLPAMLPKVSPLTDPAGAKQASFNSPGYFGSGACNHVYEHRLYALDVETLNPPQSTAASVNTTLTSMASIVLGQTFVRLESRDYCN